MGRIELFAQHGEVKRGQQVCRNGYIHLECLADEAHLQCVGEMQIVLHAERQKARFEALAQFVERAANRGRRRLVDRHASGRGFELGEVGGKQAEGREHTGILRHDDGADAKVLGDAARVQRPGAAEGYQHIVARIAAQFGRDQLNRAHHVRVGETDRAVGGGFQRHTQGLCEGLVGSPCGIDVQAHAPAEEGLGLYGAADDVRVGDGRRRAAAAVAGRARVGAGGARAHAQHAPGVLPDDAAAAGPYRRDVDHRRTDRQAVDCGLRRDDGFAVGHQANIGAGTTHVEGDQIGKARGARLADRAGDPGGGP